MDSRALNNWFLSLIILFLTVVCGQSLSGEAKCERIRVPECDGWNFTLVPNEFLGIETQIDAKTRIAEFKPLYRVNCAPELKLFICAMSVPLCFWKDGTPTPVYPCRSMCELARKGCEPIMTKYKFNWPELLNCDRLPKEGSLKICMSSPKSSNAPFKPQWNESTKPPLKPQWNESTKPPLKPLWTESTKPLFTPNQNESTKPLFTPNQNESTKPLFTPNQNESSKAPFKPKRNESDEEKFTRHEDSLYPTDEAHHKCVCNTSGIVNKRQKSFMEAWISTWLTMCLLSMLF